MPPQALGSHSLPLYAPLQGGQFAIPPPPVSLTAGIPDPQEIAKQKEEYRQRLDAQQTQGEEIINRQTDRQREYLRMQAEQQKALASGQCDQQLRVEEVALEQQYQRQLEELHEGARRQKLLLHKQASDLVLEFNARRTQEEINHRQYGIQLQTWEAEHRMSSERAGITEQQRRSELDHSSLTLSQRQSHTAHRVSEGLPEFHMDHWVNPHSGSFRHMSGSQGPYPPSPLLGS